MRILSKRTYQHPFMITLDCVKPRFTEKLQTIQNAGAAINQISHGYHPINLLVEVECIKTFVKINRLKMDITDHKISAVVVLRKPQNIGHDVTNFLR
ncbi:hypothetical protein SRM1_03957 [Pseudomonas fluorescens]|nr:hypothetical protein SRM1_03957 [Pseudomonas fluorescens]